MCKKNQILHHLILNGFVMQYNETGDIWQINISDMSKTV